MGIQRYFNNKSKGIYGAFLPKMEVVKSIKDTRLCEVWDIVEEFDRVLTEGQMLVLMALLVYSDDKLYLDVLKFARTINCKRMIDAFKAISDARILQDFVNSPEFLDTIVEDDQTTFMAESDVDGSIKIGVQGVSSEYLDKEEQTVTFRDGEDMTFLDMSAAPDQTRTNEDYQEVNSLAKYLERPIVIARYTWTPGGVYNDTSNYSYDNVWKEYMSISAVTNKITNFRMFRATGMKLQFRINGSPFHYGRLYAFYIPQNANSLPYNGMSNPFNQAILPENMDFLNATTFPLLTNYSQFPGVFIDPATNQVVEMIIPFFYYQNYVSIASVTDMTALGAVQIIALNPLQHSNGATDPITLTITASMIDPILTLPTSALAFTGESDYSPKKPPKPGKPRTPNSKKKEAAMSNTKSAASSTKNDEYGKGAVSAPATALANFAGTLERVPIIGPYAVATKMAAGKISQIAKLFGYSKPINLSDHCLVNQRSTGPLAYTIGSDDVQKLTLDPKQEVTIDPNVVGLQNIDEMSFAHIFKRESLIAQVPWAMTVPAGNNLVNIAINPFNCPANITDNGVFFNTALSWAVTPFMYWRGSLKYRFQFVCSQMHRGRIAIAFNPNFNTGVLPNQATAYQQFVDLADCKDITVEVRYAHQQPWLEIASPNNQFISKGTSVSFTDAVKVCCNGMLSLYALNELTAPVNTSDITINVFISAGEDFMVADPGSPTFSRLSPFTTEIQTAYLAEADFVAQADYVNTHESIPVSDSISCVINGSEGDTPDVDNMNMVFFGEQAVSLRNLLKRYCRYNYYVPTFTGTPTNLCRFEYFHGHIPMARGISDSNATAAGNENLGFTDATGAGYNYCNNTFLDWYRRGFVGYRGSTRWKILPSGTSPQSISIGLVKRQPKFLTTVQRYASSFISNVSGALTDTDLARHLAVNSIIADNTMAGSMVEYLRVKGFMEFESPFYSNCRYILNNPGVVTNVPSALNAINYMWRNISCSSHQVNILGASTNLITAAFYVETWVAAGEDFSLHYFLSAPVTGFTNPSAV